MPERRKRPARGAPEKCKNNAAANTGKRTGTQGLAADDRFQRRVTAVWEFGPGVLALLLGRLADEHDCRRQVERYLDSAIEHSDAIKRFGLGPGAAL